MGLPELKREKVDHSLLYHEFRWATAWGWSIIGVLAIISSLTSQDSINSWQIQYCIAILFAIGASLIFHRIFNSALSYAPVPLVLWISPFFLTDSNQKPWISIGFIGVATIISLSNIEDLKIVIPLQIAAIVLQQFMAYQNLPAITDSNDLTLLKGYFSISWCVLIGIGLIFIRQGYIQYHDSVEEQIYKLYENKFNQQKNILAINTNDYRNLRLHGTVLNTLIYARDNMKLANRKEQLRLANLIRADIIDFESKGSSKASLELRLREVIAKIGNRDLDVWISPINEVELEDEVLTKMIEIIRERVLNLKKHTNTENCEISIKITPIYFGGISFIKPIEYKLVVEIKDDGLIYSDISKESHLNNAMKSKSLTRLLTPLGANQEFRFDGNYLIHAIQIPVINFKPNMVERLFELHRTSQEFAAKSYVLISMLYGAIAIPALIQIGAAKSIIGLSILISMLSMATIFLPKRNLEITILNAVIALIPLFLAINNESDCANIQYLPWLFNGLMGPVFFAVLATPQRYLRWIPAALFFIESIYVSKLLPKGCNELLAGSTPGILVLSLLAMLVITIRSRNTQSDRELVRRYRQDSNRYVETKIRIEQEQEELIEDLAKFASLITMSRFSEKELLKQINLRILLMRALLISTEYFNSELVRATYSCVKNRLKEGAITELHILTSNFKEFTNESSYTELEKMLRYRVGKPELVVSIVDSGKTEVTVSRKGINRASRIFFEDKAVRIKRN